MRTWSFSSLNTFMTCPRQYYLTYVNKVIPYQETEATLYGSRVHLALEEYGRDGKPVPEDCKKFTKYVDKLLSLPGEHFFERKFALTRKLEPCDFEDSSAWCRGIVDLGIIGDTRAQAWDFKTGKVRPDSDQLKLFAGFLMQHYNVEAVKTAYLWLKFDKRTVETYSRDDLPSIWDHFFAKTRKLEVAYEKDKWIQKPSGLCNGWCGAGKHCEFWKPKRN